MLNRIVSNPHDSTSNNPLLILVDNQSFNILVVLISMLVSSIVHVFGVLVRFDTFYIKKYIDNLSCTSGELD